MKALHDLGIWPIVRIPHPGYGQSYDHSRDERVGAGYARAIHRYRSAFTDCSIFGYLVAKHFEIAATGSLLVADRAAKGLLAQLGMFEGEHYIATSNDDMEETIQFVIDESHHRELDEVRRRGQRLVWEKHTTRERARLIDATFNDRLERAGITAPFSPPCKGGVRGGGQGITNSLGRVGDSAEIGCLGTAYRAPGFTETTPPNPPFARGGKRGIGMNTKLVHAQLLTGSGHPSRRDRRLWTFLADADGSTFLADDGGPLLAGALFDDTLFDGFLRFLLRDRSHAERSHDGEGDGLGDVRGGSNACLQTSQQRLGYGNREIDADQPRVDRNISPALLALALPFWPN